MSIWLTWDANSSGLKHFCILVSSRWFFYTHWAKNTKVSAQRRRNEMQSSTPDPIQDSRAKLITSQLNFITYQNKARERDEKEKSSRSVSMLGDWNCTKSNKTHIFLLYLDSETQIRCEFTKLSHYFCLLASHSLITMWFIHAQDLCCGLHLLNTNRISVQGRGSLFHYYSVWKINSLWIYKYYLIWCTSTIYTRMVLRAVTQMCFACASWIILFKRNTPHRSQHHLPGANG